MFFRRLPLVGALLFCFGCGSKQAPAVSSGRTAVLRFENLSGDSGADWKGRALSELLKIRFGAEQTPRAASSAPGISTERSAAVASGATRIITGYYTVQKGSMRVTAVAEDVQSGKIGQSLRAEGDVFRSATVLGDRFGAPVAPLPTSNIHAIQEYAVASDASAKGAEEHFTQAIAADPNFGPAYLGLVRTAAALGDLAAVDRTLAAASARGQSISAQDRAYLMLEASRRDPAGRVDALRAVSNLNPHNVDSLRALADAEFAAHKPRDAAEHYGQAVALAPADAELRNLLAYAKMFSGDASGALATIAEYRRLNPQDPNALDSEGDIHFYFGQLAEAQKAYVASANLNPAFQDGLDLWKAARVGFMAEGTAVKSALFDRYIGTLRTLGSPWIGYRTAEWQYLNGNRSLAIKTMMEAADSASQPAVKSACYAQAALWAVISRDFPHGIAWSEKALHPTLPATVIPAALARFLAQPAATPAEWEARANRSFSGAGGADVRRLALGYALLMAGNFREAVPVWKQVYEASSPNDFGPRYLYAWALLKSGDSAAAGPLLQGNPIPALGITPSFEALYFPALLEWRKGKV